MRLVPTKCVPEDAVLSEALYNEDGRILVNAGAQLTSNLVERINQNHIYSVYIKDQHSTGEIDRLVDPLLRQKGHNLVKKIFDAASNVKPDGTPAPIPILAMMPELSALMDDIIYEMTGFKEKQLEYIDIKNVNSYLYSSAINVALLSVLIGWEMGLNNDMIYQLFMGGIFHDIGMAMLPKEVLYKKEPLTMEDKRQLLYHPSKGYDYLKDKVFLSSYVRAVTLGHHEHADGSGYPNRKSGGEIHLLTQIVGIADMYDAMTSDRPYRQAMPANEALEYIMSVADKHYSVEITKAFIRKVNPYPVGSLVKLKDGQTAVVRKVPAEMPFRPLISIIKKKSDGFEYEDVNLMENQTIAIAGIQY
ncbi:MAG TPA: HD-GYP domain-containing protein [Clostridia bacterium]|nr:HD-GYP domain-containing protein [Clostridia bacterium]